MLLLAAFADYFRLRCRFYFQRFRDAHTFGAMPRRERALSADARR